jgi:hypothetical protein
MPLTYILSGSEDIVYTKSLAFHPEWQLYSGDDVSSAATDSGMAVKRPRTRAVWSTAIRKAVRTTRRTAQPLWASKVVVLKLEGLIIKAPAVVPPSVDFYRSLDYLLSSRAAAGTSGVIKGMLTNG